MQKAECSHHLLLPDAPPYSGSMSSYNFPFGYRDAMWCRYRLHLPLHLVPDARKFQICFRFLRSGSTIL